MDVEGVEAGAALVEGLEHDELGGVQQLDGFALAEALGRTVVMQPGTPQRFVRINVADAAHHGLVEERPLHRAAARSQGRRNPVGIETVIERIEGNVLDLPRQLGAARRELQPAEHALVDESELRTTVGEVEQHPCIGQQRCVRIVDAELAAHAQMDEQRIGVVQGQPEVLPAATGNTDPASNKIGGEGVRTGQVIAHRPGVQNMHRTDRAAGDR